MPVTLRITLPPLVRERELPIFLETTLPADDEAITHIIFDERDAERHTPGCIVAVSALVRRWLKAGKKVTFENCSGTPGYGALIQTDAAAAMTLTSPVFELDWAVGPLDPWASKIATLVAPDGWAPEGPFPVVQYALGELFSNCRQHAGSNAFVHADSDESRETPLVRFAVADCGEGLKGSFFANQSPHLPPGSNDSAAIAKALEPCVSSTTYSSSPYNRSSNFGIGLSKVRAFALLTGGSFAIISGRSWRFEAAGEPPSSGEFSGGCEWPGTIVNVAMMRNLLGDYLALQQQVHRAVGLPTARGDDKLFQ